MNFSQLSTSTTPYQGWVSPSIFLVVESIVIGFVYLLVPHLMDTGELLFIGIFTAIVVPLLWFIEHQAHRRQLISEELRASEERWQFALESNRDGVWDWNIPTGEVFFSTSYAEMYGFAKNELTPHESEWSKRLHPDDVHRVMTEVQGFLKGNDPTFYSEFRMQCKDGSWKWILSRGKLLSRDADGNPLRMIGTHTDISQFKAQQNALRMAAEIFEQNTQSIIVTTAPDNKVVRVNPAFTQITGYSAEEALGKNPNFLESARHSEEFFLSMWETIVKDGQWRGEIWNKRKNGEIYPELMSITAIKDKNGEITHYVSLSSDISKSKQAEEQIRDLAYYDTLTGLPNRRLLEDRLKLALANAHRNNSRVGLLFLDLDHFKTINDSLGHLAGDLLLTQSAQRISACVREGDTVARQGGDEFVLLLPDLANDHDALYAASTVAEKIRDELRIPFDLNGYEAAVTPSIGIAIYPMDADNMVDLVRNADTAMYHAKKHGRNNYQFYASNMNANAVKRLGMDNALRHAIERNELSLYYQPQVDAEGKILSAEALLRWNSTLLGEIMPAQFIPLAEENGLIIPIGKWVLETACAQMRAWLDAGLVSDKMRIAVNISPRQFAHADFNMRLVETLDNYKLHPKDIELEVTEGVLMQNTQESLAKLDELKALGFKISVDDFGTGYSSLSYLKHFPIDVLKIDQSFVRDISNDADDAAISRAIISMAKNLNLKVIAEGVETIEQLKFLKENGCDAYQGYHFSRPMPAAELTALLAKP
jgi:diguanylate cyclase (GGDEF)-like protein/PAS domain S-box-containing protein